MDISESKYASTDFWKEKRRKKKRKRERERENRD